MSYPRFPTKVREKETDKGKGAGTKSNTSSHKQREAAAAKKGGKGGKVDKAVKPPYKPPTQARVTEMALFAATARQECWKKKCENKDCWKTKNHAGHPALPKIKPSGANAATSEDVPQNYGDLCIPCGEPKTTASDDSEGFTKVAGTFVASVAPAITKTELSNRSVPPSTFAEDLSEDEV